LKATILDTHIEVSSAHWTYVFDRAGHQIFRPITLLPHLKATLTRDIGPILTRWLEKPVPEELVMQAKQIVQSTFGGDASVGAAIKAMPTRELITSKKADSEKVRFHEGRIMVLFSREKPDASMVRSYRSSMGYTVDGHPVMKVESADTPSRSYEAAITFAPGGGKLIRAESSIQSPEVRDAARSLNEGLAKGTILGRATPYDFSLRFGSFHDPDEKRFELNAYSYEGEKFLQPSNWLCSADECDNYEDEKCRDCNPFYPCFPDPDIWWCSDAMFPTTDEYRNRTDYRNHYRYWSWYWWFIFGQKNGIRGNWNESTQSWEKGVTVSPPKNLESYDFTGLAGPLQQGFSCNNDPFSYRAATGKKLKAPFYQDLESNHIALINTHGGPIDGVYQMRRGMDIWFKLHEEGDDGLGKGRLRYLFLETCSGMNWNNNVFWQPQNLFTDWMNWHVADGLRMALGYDGSRIGHFWNGWLFFGYYHGGDSISQAWFNQALLTHSCNVPVVVAYGDTEEETLATLLDGRFKRSRGGKGWIIASEVLTHALLNEPRPCCMPGGSCVAKTRFECLNSGGRPHECGKSCGDEDVTCPNP
jgi:hypothetical protein